MTSTTHPAIITVPTAPEGIVRLFVPDGIVVSKAELRTAAARVAKTIDVGRTPAGKTATFRGVKGTGYDFAPVQRSGKGDAAPAEVPAAEDDPRVAVLRTLGLSAEQVAAVLAVSPAAPATGKGTGKGSKGTGKASAKETPSFIVARAQAREAAAAQCGKCLGFGKVRTTPRLAKKTGQPVKYPYAFRTAQGAANAPTGVVCDQCGGQAATA